MATILEPGKEAAANGSLHNHALNGAVAVRPSQAAAHGSFWSKRAPKRLRRGGLSPDAAWEAYWKDRKRPATVARLCRAKSTPLSWAWNAAGAAPECRALVELADKLARGAAPARFAKPNRRSELQEALSHWLDAVSHGEPSMDCAIGCLAAAHLLNELGGLLDAEFGWSLVDLLFATATEARHLPADGYAVADMAVARQILAGELPLTLSYNFPEMGPAPALARASQQALREGFAVLLSGKGFLRGTQLQALRPLAACWTRCGAIGSRLKQGAWNAATQRKFEAFAQQAIRWSDAAGRPLLSDAEAPTWTADFLASLLRLAGGKPETVAAKALIGRRSKAKAAAKAEHKAFAPSCHSEPAGLAIMRSAWSPRAATVAVNYSTLDMGIEASAGGRQLFAGVWTAEPRVDGNLLKPTGAWDEVCWFTDADVDYLEFSLDLENGAKLERQILLARRDAFLLLVDHLQNPASALIDLTMQLPLAAELQWQGEEETRDAVLSAGKPVARLLPLAMPEWRVDPRVGELTHADGAVRLAARTAARAIACPLFIDLDRRRAAKPCTWRLLTVAESLEIVPPDVAVAYRIQCGRDQWVYYRAQSASGNRTFIGQNTSHECVIARFRAPSGEIEELLEIEA
jgi:hypothetical protein